MRRAPGRLTVFLLLWLADGLEGVALILQDELALQSRDGLGCDVDSSATPVANGTDPDDERRNVMTWTLSQN